MNNIKIELAPNEYCNCCSATEQSEKIYAVRFSMGASTTVIKLCDKHLKELNKQITTNIFSTTA